MKRIGLLGCGAIGTQIALAIDTKIIPARLTHVYDKDKTSTERLVSILDDKPQIVENSHLLSSNSVDIIVEAASPSAVRDVGLSVLQNHKDLMIMSVGALLDDTILEVLTDACHEFNKMIYLPSGAIAGLDGIRCVQHDLKSVSITTTKHPDSLRGAPFFKRDDAIHIDKIESPTVIFKGSAREAVLAFPANVNVSAILSLAGIGGDKTVVCVVADPNAKRNIHRIEATGGFGRMEFVIENMPSTQNPKTSQLAALSAIEVLRGYCSAGVRMGS